MKLGDLVSVAPEFSRSISVGYDLENEDRVAGYIPTKKSEGVIGHVLSAVSGRSSEGATMLTGSYGTGKSHLSLFLCSLLGKQASEASLRAAANRISDPYVSSLVDEELSNPSPFLVVPLLGGSGDSLERQLLSALKRSIQRAGLDVDIPSSYASALSAISLWQERFPHAYESLQRHLAESGLGSVDDLASQLEAYSSEALRFFARVYPDLAAGAEFDHFSGDAVSTIVEVNTSICESGYRGTFIVIDEFSRVLESATDSGSVSRILQDLAEAAGRSSSGRRIHVLLVSHQTFQQLLSRLDPERSVEWQKIEGRFGIFDISNLPWEDYGLMSRALVKQRNDFYDAICSKRPDIRAKGEHRRLSTVFDPLSYEEIMNTVVIGCFPLHPITTFILPRASARLAQNERTVFTFLAARDNSPLRDLFDQDISQLDLVAPWQVFDYFSEQIRRSTDDQLREVYIKVKSAESYLPEGSVEESRLLKTIGAFLIACSPTLLPCTIELISYAFGEGVFEKALDGLLKQRLVYIREATQELEIIEPIDLDIEAEIQKWQQERPSGHSPLDELRRFAANHYVIPRRHNHQNSITRFLTPVFADIDYVQAMVSRQGADLGSHVLDGAIIYAYPEDSVETGRLADLALKIVDPRVIIAIPRTPVPVRRLIRRVQALEELRGLFQQQGRMSSRVRTVLDIYVNDAQDALLAQVEAVTRPSSQVRYFSKGKEISDFVKTPQSLSEYASLVMDEVFDRSPRVVNELINKENPTSTSVRARNAVIDAVLEWPATGDLRFKSAQERFMFITLFEVTGLASAEGDLSPSESSRVGYVIDAVRACIQSSGSIAATEIVRLMKSPPYGVRQGLMPVLLTALLREMRRQVVIRDESGSDRRLDAALVSDIVTNPSKYTLVFSDWGQPQEKLISGVARIFGQPSEHDRGGSAIDSLMWLAERIYTWFTDLPRIARETRHISQRAMSFRRCLRLVTVNPKQVLVAQIPKAIGFAEYDQEDVAAICEAIGSIKSEIESALGDLMAQVNLRVFRWLAPDGVPLKPLGELVRDWATLNLPVLSSSPRWTSLAAFAYSQPADEPGTVRRLAHALTGVAIEDWIDDTIDRFESAILEIDNLVRQTNGREWDGPYTEIRFADADGNWRSYTVRNTEVSELARVLESHLLQDIQGFGEAITQDDRRQILLSILKQYL
jgi:hypothetical protein